MDLTLSSPCSDPLLSRQGAALAHLESLPPYNLILGTDGCVSFLLGKSGSGALANCSLCGTEATLPFLAGSVCSSFSDEACAILQAFCWSRQYQQVYHFSYLLLLYDSRSVLATMSFPPSFYFIPRKWLICSQLHSFIKCSFYHKIVSIINLFSQNFARSIKSIFLIF